MNRRPHRLPAGQARGLKAHALGTLSRKREREGSLQMLLEERGGVVPQLVGRALAIARPVIGEERVAGVLRFWW